MFQPTGTGKGRKGKSGLNLTCNASGNPLLKIQVRLILLPGEFPVCCRRNLLIDSGQTIPAENMER